MKVPPSPPRVILVLGLSLVAALAAGCSRSPSRSPVGAPRTADVRHRQVQVEIAGSPGLRFEGSLGDPGAARAISGVTPAQFQAQVRQTLYLRVQKTGRDGRLAVRVLMDGREVAAYSTSKPFGLVTVLYPPTR